MLKVCLKKIPKDLFISVAAVTDWKINYNKHKMKKEEGIPKLKLIDNPDILKSISFHKKSYCMSRQRNCINNLMFQFVYLGSRQFHPRSKRMLRPLLNTKKPNQNFILSVIREKEIV